MSRLITILGVITAVAFAIAPELTSINPKASRYVMLVGVAAAAAGGSLLKRKTIEASNRFLMILVPTIVLLTAPLAGCNQTDFERAQKLSRRATVAIASAPVLVDSFIQIKLINEELGLKIQGVFDSFGPYLVQANDWLQGAKSLDAITKVNVLALLRAALEQVDKISAGGLSFITSEKVRKQVLRILNLARALIAGAVAYLAAAKLAALFMRPFAEREVAKLEKLMRPEPSVAPA